MKTSTLLIPVTLLLALLATEATALSISELRLQERHFALADFKTIYKQRQYLQHRLIKKQRRQRIKHMTHSTLCNNKTQRGPKNQTAKNDFIHGMHNINSSQNDTAATVSKPGRHQFNNPWATKR